MATAHTVNGSRWEELDRDEMATELDAQSRRLLGIGLDEFLDRHRNDDLPDTPAVDYLAMASGVVRPG